jgi:hypothetical protein
MTSGALTSDVTAANTALVKSWTLSLHGKASRTVKHYLDETWRFVGWLAEHERPVAVPGDLLAVGRRDVEARLMAQRTAGLAQATMRTRINPAHLGRSVAERRRQRRRPPAWAVGSLRKSCAGTARPGPSTEQA